MNTQEFILEIEEEALEERETYPEDEPVTDEEKLEEDNAE